MELTPTVGLAVTVHQPDDRLARLTEIQLPALAARYASLTAFCSRETHPTILDLLRDQGVSVKLDGGEPGGIDDIGGVRRATVSFGLQAGTSHLQMCDFDRAIHWVACYPQELEAVIADIPNYDLLVLGRTDRAWATHPPYQAETEPLFNRVFALVSGLEWDVGAGSRGLSRPAAETLLRLSQEMTVGVDAEWPLLLLNQEGYCVGHRRCEGLEFETADRFASEIEAAGSYQAWEAEMDSDPRQWIFRLRIAMMIAEAALRYAGSEQQETSRRPSDA
jgi:hypothetical protein